MGDVSINSPMAIDGTEGWEEGRLGRLRVSMGDGVIFDATVASDGLGISMSGDSYKGRLNGTVITWEANTNGGVQTPWFKSSNSGVFTRALAILLAHPYWCACKGTCTRA